MNFLMPSRLLLLAITFSFGVRSAQGLHFFVDGDPAKGDNRRSVQSAQNPDTPLRTITYALRLAHIIDEGRPHTIEIAPGTYSPSTGETFPLVISRRGINLKPTGTTILDAKGRSNFFQLTPAVGDFAIQGFLLRNGKADKGGAIYCESCTLRVEGNRFFDNQASTGGHALYARNGRIAFANNQLRNNGGSTSDVAVVELHNTFVDTSYRDVIRNNTFYRNYSPNILTSGNRTDIDSNIFLDPGEPPIVDASMNSDPLMRYNLFWGNQLLFITDQGNSIEITRTERDTVTLDEQGLVIPEFMTGPPDTLATAGVPYEFEIPVEEEERDSYKFKYIPLSDNTRQPVGLDTALVREQGVVRWTPALADTGRYWVNIEIFTSDDIPSPLLYFIHVFPPDEVPAKPGPIVFVTVFPDTAGALSALNGLVPSFSSAASAGNNIYADPVFLDSTYNHFDPLPGSPAIDTGNPIIALRDSPGRGRGTRRNDIGSTGGPGLPDPPLPDTSFSELEIVTLPDSVAVEGQVYTYEPVFKVEDEIVEDKIIIIDLIQGLELPPTMHLSFGSGKRSPITWTPTLADTGTYLIGVKVYTTNIGDGRHYFPLRVQSSNQPPRITSDPGTLALEDSTYAYAIQATDANDDPLAFILISGPQGMTFDADTGLLSWIPAQKDVGVHSVVVRVTDPDSAAAEQRFSLTVLNTNDAPAISSAPDTIAVEDSPYVYALTATDPDPGDALTFSLGIAPQGMRIDSTGLLSWTPGQADVGIYSIVVRVADAAGATAEQRFSLQVTEVDDPPVIASQPDTLAFEDQLYQYAVQGVDEEGLPLTYALETAPEGMSIDATGLLSWTPDQQDIGVYPITVQAADPAGQTAVQRFELRVQAVNDPPRIIRVEPPADSLLVVPFGQPLLFRVEADDEESDSDSLSTSWWVNGVLLSTGASREHRPGSTAIDTLTARVSDGIDTTAVTWLIDGRPIPHISVAVDTVDFGAVALGDTGRVVLAAANTGNAPLAISGLRVDDPRFAAAFSSAPVPTGDAVDLELRFAPTDRQTIISAVSFSTDDPDAPTVRIPLSGRGYLPGDFTDDEIVDFDDFFLFADYFGTTAESPGWDPRFSLNGDEVVDFDDFFLFADYFGRTAGAPLTLLGDFADRMAKPVSSEADLLDLRFLPRADNLVELLIGWQGKQRPRGYVLVLEFDPEQLEFREFVAAADPLPLLWVVDNRPGMLTVAAGLATHQEEFRDAELGILRFVRLTPGTAAIEPAGALVRFRDRTSSPVSPGRLSLAALPRMSTLYPPYPNPFNATVALTLYLPHETQTQLRMYDLLGRPVRTLADGLLTRGYHDFSWQGRDQQDRPVGAGLYLVELRTAEMRQVRKLLLLK